MVERKLFKTKLCVAFQKGRCTRNTCSFAHGVSELRRCSGSFHGKRDFGNDDLRDKHFGNDDLRDKQFRNGDLRDKLDRMHSPRRVHSPVRDERSRNTYHEHGRSRSPEKARKHRKKQRLDYQSDISGSLRISDIVELEAKEGKFSTQSRGVLEEKLKQVELDVIQFDQQKCELLVNLDGRMQEVESLTSKIQELEAQLCKEKVENQRILSKIDKFVKAYNHHTGIQDQLKKSEVWLHKLGDDLGSDINKISGNEEDLRVNVVSDDETCGSPFISNNEKQNNGRHSNRKQEAEVLVKAPVTSKKVSRWNVCPQPSYDEEIEVAVVSRDGQPSQTKSTVSKLASPLTNAGPSHADEEEVEIELEDNLRLIETRSKRVGEIKGSPPLTLPPPPPILKTNYSEYEGDDESIDVDEFDEDV